MTLQAPVGGEFFPTGSTMFEANLGVYDVFMVLQTFSGSKGLFTVRAHERFLP